MKKTTFTTVILIGAAVLIAGIIGCSAYDKTSASQKADSQKSPAVVAEEIRSDIENQRRQAVVGGLDNSSKFITEQRYEEALGQLEQVLAVDPYNDRALREKALLEDGIKWREQLEGQKLNDGEEIKLLLKAQKGEVPYSDELTHPKNWKELVARRKNTSGVGRGRYVTKFGTRSSTGGQSGVPMLGGIPIAGGLFRNVDSGVPIGQFLASVGDDEIWVIAQPDALTIIRDDETPGCGAMVVVLPGKEEKVPLPLKHTDVKAGIAGYVATVEVTQEFHNPYDTKIEASYVFPLPQNAAVSDFVMVIGDRKIRGIIRRREEAEKIYAEARSQGYTASLLTQERPNIFTQKVANIEPGKQINVNITYFNTLAYVDGWYEFVFPMVVGPRYNPAGSTDGVGSVGYGNAGASGQKTEVQYLKPTQLSSHDISLAVDIDAGVKIEKIECKSHVITKKSVGKNKRQVAISGLDNIPNKDFVLRYQVAGSVTKSAVMTQKDKRGGFFTMMLYPPEDLKYLKRAPMEMIFVLDCSGSMSGKPLAKSKDAIKRALRKLQPGDSFQVIRFSNNASQLGAKPLEATEANVKKGIRYVDSLKGYGGTQMIEGIKAALDFEHDPERYRLVTFMTDGYIGNEADILAAVHNKLGKSRIFSFGIGSSVNRYLLDRMAKLGKGAVAYIGPDDSATKTVDLFYDRISHPALTDVRIDFGDMEVEDVYPAIVPDLIAGRPVILTGRYTGSGRTNITVKGNIAGCEKTISIPVDLSDPKSSHKGIASVWARKKIESLATRSTYDSNTELPELITSVALEFNLMSKYTSFVAVDSSRKTAGDHGISVVVPVPVPDGVKYETTVQN